MEMKPARELLAGMRGALRPGSTREAPDSTSSKRLMALIGHASPSPSLVAALFGTSPNHKKRDF
jgi:hypothetical protein